MRTTVLRLLVVSATIIAPMASASTLTVRVSPHTISYEEQGERRTAYALFTDEPVTAEVQLDVYRLPQLRSTHQHYESLMKLTVDDWHHSLTWRLTRVDVVPEQVVSSAPARILQSRVRERGPNAPLPANRDATVDCRTFVARADFGAILPGAYRLTAMAVPGVESTIEFEVRTGQEPLWRDTYLEIKASKAKTFDEYRAITLSRLELAPDRLSLVWDLLDRSLVYGSLNESRSYLSRAREIVLRLGGAPGAKKVETDKSLDFLAELDATVVSYYQHRGEWTLTRDPREFRYSVRSKKDGRVIKEVRVRD